MRNIIQLIRARGETFVVHDPKREFYREFYRPGIDWAIDPRLEECPYWAMEDEAADEPEATPWASSFFPEHPRSQPFFVRKPRAIFAYLMSRYSAHNEPRDPATCARLGSWLAAVKPKFFKRVKGTEHYRSLNRGGSQKVEISDQSQGLFSTLGEIAKVLRMMPAKSGRAAAVLFAGMEKGSPGLHFPLFGARNTRGDFAAYIPLLRTWRFSTRKRKFTTGMCRASGLCWTKRRRWAALASSKAA